MKPYKCQFCRKEFTLRCNMYRHVRESCKYKHKNKPMPLIKKKDDDDDENNNNYNYNNNSYNDNNNSYKDDGSNHTLDNDGNDTLDNDNSDTLCLTSHNGLKDSNNINNINTYLDTPQNIIPDVLLKKPEFKKSIEKIIAENHELKEEKLRQEEINKNDLKELKDQIANLAEIIQTKKNNNVTNNNTTIINQNIIYVTDSVDYLDILSNKLGEKKAIEFIQNKIHCKLEGDVAVFCKIYLDGPPSTWPVKCFDKKGKKIILLQPDNTILEDPGGLRTHKNFTNNYLNAILKLSNQYISKVTRNAGSPEFEKLRDELLDDIDLGKLQTKACEISHTNPSPFIKQLVERMENMEKSNTIFN